MNSDQLILKELKSINKRLDEQGTAIERLESTMATKDDLKVLEAGQKQQGAAIERIEKTTVKKTDLPSFINLLTPVIDKRAEMTELFTKAEILASEQRTKIELREEIKAVHEHLHEDIKETKEELQAEILASRAAAHEDSTKIASLVAKNKKDTDIRLDALEEHNRLSNPLKH
jgi:hypothetical protein